MRNVILAALLVLCSASAEAAEPAPGVGIKCNAELSGGYSFANARVADTVSSVSVDLAADGVVIALGGGCDVVMSKFVAGVLGRYHFGKTDTAFDGTTIELDKLWMMGGRLGYQVQPSTTLYVLGGWSGAGLHIEGVADKTIQGLVYGLGLDARVTSAVSLRVEWSRHDFKRFTIDDARLAPDLNVVRLGIIVDLN